MMKPVEVLCLAALALAGGMAVADDELYKTKNCFACHRIDKDYHGPSFKSIATRYANDAGVEARLSQKIREGSVGTWGQSPMPPQAQVTEAEAMTLARWILEQK